jgi:hypothetical protein
LLFSRSRRLLPLLSIAGVVKIGDVVIGLAARNPGMVFGAGTLAALHLATAARIVRGERRRSSSVPRGSRR